MKNLAKLLDSIAAVLIAAAMFMVVSGMFR